MTRFESYELPTMVDLVAAGNPQALARAGRGLTDMRAAFLDASRELRGHLDAVEWRGEAGTEFRRFGGRLALHAEDLGTYAHVVGVQLTEAATGLASVRNSMPPKSAAGTADPEPDRQEAINQLNRLASYYTTTAAVLREQDPPAFDADLKAAVPRPTTPTPTGTTPGTPDAPGPRPGAPNWSETAPARPTESPATPPAAVDIPASTTHRWAPPGADELGQGRLPAAPPPSSPQPMAAPPAMELSSLSTPSATTPLPSTPPAPTAAPASLSASLPPPLPGIVGGIPAGPAPLSRAPLTSPYASPPSAGGGRPSPTATARTYGVIGGTPTSLSPPAPARTAPLGPVTPASTPASTRVFTPGGTGLVRPGPPPLHQPPTTRRPTRAQRGQQHPRTNRPTEDEETWATTPGQAPTPPVITPPPTPAPPLH
ncbi:hypothetical protein [Streptomyces candidus]|uniref:Uncharacterized protein n=1 Tax=Streptomyces candidus TaxID=67283 RepID=A0A7X0HJ21_9ACTN|nr:hypothetical protein [Streptomyces candidus]MBB6438440.1 hypothetical protein [Streptomyces candidus]GHH52411.1 hypothetical protein GCM10018773_52450 [Streptomyces candidus]